MTFQLARAIGPIAITCGLYAGATAAYAASAQTWVGGGGTDAGACPVTAPCRTFGYALTQTVAGGTINVVSASDFVNVEINKSVSIVADGVEATIQNAGACSFAPGGSAAICINAGSAGVVNLRGLNIDMHGSPNAIAVSVGSAAAVHVQNALIRGAKFGINHVANTNADLFVSDTTIANHRLSAIYVRPTASVKTRIVLSRVQLEKNKDGLMIDPSARAGRIEATIRDSVAAGNSAAGIAGISTSEATGVLLMIERTNSAYNATGISANGAGAVFRLGESTVTGNTTGLSAINGAAIISFGSNKISGNGPPETPSGTEAYK